MSHHVPGLPKLGITSANRVSVVTYPTTTMHNVHAGVARALLSLTVLEQLFRTGSLGNEEATMPHLLAYIIEGLQECDSQIGQYMREIKDGGSHD